MMVAGPLPIARFGRIARRVRITGAGVACVAALAGSPPAVSAQAFEGRVVAAGYGTPIVAATVELLDAGLVTLTDDEGRFEFLRIASSSDSVRITRLGYATTTVHVVFGDVDEPTFELERRPIELEGISTELDFAGRLAVLDERLDQRIGEWPGTARVVGADDIRPFDDEWEGNPWKALHYSPLGVRWAGDFSGAGALATDRAWIDDFGYARPEVWIDDRQVWLQALIETPNESLCRLEVYAPKRYYEGVQPLAQLRAYTCAFLARVAEGHVEVCPVLQWGRLISGPDAGGGLARVDRRAAVRPPGSVTPIDLGPDLDLSVTATGVGSGACL